MSKKEATGRISKQINQNPRRRKVKFEEITIDEVRAETVPLSDQETYSTDSGFSVSFYRDGKSAGSITGVMVPMEEKQKIPPFTVDFLAFD